MQETLSLFGLLNNSSFKKSFIVFIFCAIIAISVSASAAIRTSDVDAPRREGSIDNNKEEYKEDEVLVKFKPGVPGGKKNSLRSKHGAKKLKEFRSLRIEHLKLKKGMSVEDAIKAFKADPDVEYAEPNYMVSIQATPNDSRFSELWGLYNTGQTGGISGADISAPEAWDITTGSSDVVVAVIDTGVDYNHEDLAANMWVNSNEIAGNGVDDDGNGYIDDIYGIDTYSDDSDPMDDNGHGTHVSGTIGAVGNNGLGVVGVNWDVKIVGCKFLGSGGSGYTSDAVECLEYIRALKNRGINIIATNNSWGGGGYSQALVDAIDAQRGILFFAAAGNSSVDNDTYDFYPANYYLPNLISVAATDSADAKASFSDYGRRTVHIGAPGVDIVSLRAANTDMYGDGNHFIPAGDPGARYYKASGTSMATPHVAGLAALIKSENPDRDWSDIKNLILAGGDVVSSMNGKTITGRRINAQGSLSCTDRPVFSFLKVPSSLTAGSPVTLSALSINCAASAGPVTVTLSGGEVIFLHDDGAAPDLAAGDGIFSATWTPASGDTEVLAFSSPAGTESIVTPPISISGTSADPPAIMSGQSAAVTRLGDYYRQTFTTYGGKTPHQWSISSGSLPTGLTLNGSTGEISGTTTANGSFSFTVKITDAFGMSDTMKFSVLVQNELRPGWPKELANRIGYGYLPRSFSPIMADINGDDKDEIIVSDVNTLYIFDANGLINKLELPGNASSPAVADLDGDGRPEIIVSSGAPIDEAIHVYHSDLTPATGFPAADHPLYHGTPGYCVSPVVQDLDGDGNKEIIVVCAPNNTVDDNYKKAYLIVVDSHGVLVPGWPKVVNGGSDWVDYHTKPAVADVDGDGKKEIAYFSLDGIMHLYKPDGQEMSQWVVTQNSVEGVKGPFLADINGDGYHEIIILYQATPAGSTYPDMYVHVFDRNGNSLSGWPKVFSSSYLWSPELVIADLDKDGRPEIIFSYAVPYFRGMQALRYDGFSLPGWPIDGWQYVPSLDAAPVVGDINGDGEPEVVFNTRNGWAGDYVINAIDADGLPVNGYPKFTTPGNEIRTAPALGDIDGNRKVDIVTKSEDGMLYVWESQQQSAALLFEWPMVDHDPQHTGNLPPGTTPMAFLFPDQKDVALSTLIMSNSITVKGISLPSPISVSSGEYEINGSGIWSSANGTVINGNSVRVRQLSSPDPGTMTTAVLTIGGVSAAFRVATVADPDLVVSSFGAPSLAGAGGTTALTDTTANTGTISAAPSTTVFYLSTDSVFNGSDVLLGSREVAALSGGAGSSGSTSATIPAGTAPGSYYIIAVADAGGAVSELNEANNTAARPVTVRSTVDVDLSVTAVSTPPGVSDGDSVEITDTTKNTGTGTSIESTTNLYISTNTTYDASDILLGSRTVPSLASGLSSQGTTTVTIPVGLWGAHYIIAVADGGGAIMETNETNNTKTSSSYFTVGLWSNFSYSAVNGSVKFTDLSSGGPTSWYWDFADGTSSTEQNPSHTYRSAGTYSVMLQIRKTGSSTSVTTHRSVTAPAGSDLAVTSMSGPSTAAAGGTIAVTDTTTNNGAGSSVSAFITSFYLSTNSTYDGSDIFLGSRSVAALGAGANSSGSASLTIPAGAAVGDYYIIAVADSGGAVPEVNESNNTNAWSITISDPSVMIPGTNPEYFSLIQDAFNAAANGDTIMVRASEFIGSLVLDRAVTVKLKGGFDCGFADAYSNTFIVGTVTISSGTVVFENIVIK